MINIKKILVVLVIVVVLIVIGIVNVILINWYIDFDGVGVGVVV